MNYDTKMSNKLFFGIAALTLAIIYSYLLVILIPVDAVMDRSNYLEMATSANAYLSDNFLIGGLYFFSNEPVWIVINVFLSTYFTPDAVISVIIFFSSFIASYLLIKKSDVNIFLILLILLAPQVMKNYVIHLRQGLAVSFFLIGYFSSNKLIKSLFWLLSPLVHSSFSFVFCIMLMSKLFKKIKVNVLLKLILLAFCFLFIASLVEPVSVLLGARQANEYDFVGADSSGLAFLFWCFILFLYISEGQEFISKNIFCICIMLFYLTTYFLLPISARIFESAIIVVLISGTRLTKVRKHLYIFLVIFYVSLSYLMSISKPYLGWGI